MLCLTDGLQGYGIRILPSYVESLGTSLDLQAIKRASTAHTRELIKRYAKSITLRMKDGKPVYSHAKLDNRFQRCVLARARSWAHFVHGGHRIRATAPPFPGSLCSCATLRSGKQSARASSCVLLGPAVWTCTAH